MRFISLAILALIGTTTAVSVEALNAAELGLSIQEYKKCCDTAAKAAKHESGKAKEHMKKAKEEIKKAKKALKEGDEDG